MNRFTLTIVLMFACLGTGFFAGYFLTRPDSSVTPTNVRSTIAAKPSPSRVEVPSTSPSGSNEPAEPLFDQLSQQPNIFATLKLAHELADSAGIDQLQTYINRAVQSRDPLYSFNIVGILLEKYTALDPLGAIEFVDNHNLLPDQQLITHVITSWVRTDPEAAIDYFKQIEDLNLRTTLGGRLLADPTLKGSGFDDEILALMGTRGNTVASLMTVRQLPPAMAFEEALTLNRQSREGALYSALNRWMREDPDQAIERILLHENLDERTRMLQSVLNEYVSIDEDAAFEFARTHLTGNARTEQHMLSVLAQRNPKRTLPLVEEFISRTGNISPLNGIISTWVQQEPKAALAYIETLEAGQQSTLYHSVAYSYVNSHPAEGFQWLLTQSDKLPQLVKNTISNSINHATVDIAERSIARISDEALKTQLIAGIGNYKASLSPEAALSWLDQYQSDQAYPIAVQSVISSMAHQNPRAAAKIVEERLDDQSAAPLVGQIAANWHRASPKDAIAWVSGLDAGDAKSSALSNMAMMVAHQDPDEAKEMIESLPSGQYRDSAKRNVGYALLSQSPDQVDAIIEDLGITGRDAEHMREMANNRSRSRTAAGVIRPVP